MSKRLFTGQKGGRDNVDRVSRRKRRRFHGNRYTKVQEEKPPGDESKSSTSTRKLSGSKFNVPIREDCGFVILDFQPFFEELSFVVKCKECDGAVSFEQSDLRGLGFKVDVKCENCGELTKIKSSPVTGEKQKRYEVNVRSVLAARAVGLGLTGLQTFCAVMDLHPPLTHSAFAAETSILADSCKSVAEKVKKAAVEEELQLTKEESGSDRNWLAVSGDGSWKKRGHTSRVGVVTLIGQKTSKILDTTVRSTYCKECEWWDKHLEDDPVAYQEWIERHALQCLATHQGSAGAMEVEGMKDIFRRSEDSHGVRYKFFIGDGDSATYKGLVDSGIYEEGFIEKRSVSNMYKREWGRDYVT